MGGDGGLIEDDAALGVDAGGDVGGGDLARVASQNLRVLRQGQGVQVDDAEDALELLLLGHPVAQGTQIVAQMQLAGRLHAREDAVHWSSPKP